MPKVYQVAGWWAKGVKSGQVHEHPENPGRSWQATMHRACQPVYVEYPGLDLPDALFIPHHRVLGPSCYFGPFVDQADLNEWYETVGGPAGVRGVTLPLYRTVDWSRD